jgi:hypothetical protein
VTHFHFRNRSGSGSLHDTGAALRRLEELFAGPLHIKFGGVEATSGPGRRPAGDALSRRSLIEVYTWFALRVQVDKMVYIWCAGRQNRQHLV